MTARTHIFTIKSRELRVMAIAVLPTVLLLNYLMFSDRYLSGLSFFLEATLILALACSLVHRFYVLLMKLLRNRFPGENQAGRRIGIALFTFIIFSGLALLACFKLYSQFHILDFKPAEGVFGQCYAVVIVINIFMMFVYESMANFDNYSANIKATEDLKKEYLESQLMGLKSQMNPHFLFNSLNTLSCLIQEENDDAEIFLDHMSKVFRYLLRNNEEKEVTLQEEINFLHSYCYLLKARHKDGFDVQVEVSDEYLQSTIPPLTLQMIVENITTHNTISRNQPLLISIYTWNQHLLVSNNIQPKLVTEGPDTKSLKNIMNKFRLLWSAEVAITETPTQRQICIPLIHQNVPAL